MDKKEKKMPNQNDKPELKVEFTPTNKDEQPTFAVKKSEQQIKADEKFVSINLTQSSSVNDINKNIGVFAKKAEVAKTVVSDSTTNKTALGSMNETKSKIDFEKFKKTKKIRTTSTSNFGLKVNQLLSTKKGVLKTWITELSIMLVVIATSIVLIVMLPKMLAVSNVGVVNDPLVQSTSRVGTIFCYIASCAFAVPAIFLMTSFFVGINGIMSSKVFHYFMWITGIISLTFFVIGFSLCMYPISELLAFNH